MAHVLVLLDSTNDDIFYCGQCKLIFNTLPLYLSHKKDDCKRKVYLAVEESSRSVTSNEPFEPNIPCSLGAVLEPNAEINYSNIRNNKADTSLRHLKMVEKPYQCVICGRCFVQNSHLQRHILTHKVWPDGISETTPKTADTDLLSYSCLYCDLTFHTYNQFRVHLKTHQCLKKFKCIQNQCHSLYETIEQLLNHVSNNHKTMMFCCHCCNKPFNSLEDISVHYQSSNQKISESLPQTKLFKCTQCDAVFRKSEKLALHMVTETHKKVCIHCNKMFSSDKRLRLHLQVHRKFKPYQCNICGQSFLMKKYLTSHLHKHGEKKYMCNICQSQFKRQDSLHRHMKSHQIRKMYKCPFMDSTDCRKEFNRTDKLKSHIKSHTKRTQVPQKKLQCRSATDS